MEDLDLLTKFALKLGGYAEGLLGYHDLDFLKAVFQKHITTVRDDLRELKDRVRGATLNLRPPNLAHAALYEEADEMWNYGQTMRFAAGITLIGLRYRDRVTEENRRRATVAKILHQCQAGLLDDLVDTGRYSFVEAKDLYHHCLVSMIDPDFEINKFRKELAVGLNPEQLSMFDLMTNITAAFNALFRESPNGQDLFCELERLDQHLVLGQALTMFQKEAWFDVAKLKRLASGLPAPDPDLPWHDRISQCLSGGSYYNLVDMCFLSEPVSQREIDTTLKSWYYLDLVITRLNHIVGVHRDLKSGIANLALIGIRENELLERRSLHGYNPNLEVQDYEEMLGRAAEFSRRALEQATAEGPEPNLFSPFIAVMIPVVMLADWIGRHDDMIHRYLSLIAPSLRQAAIDSTAEPSLAVVPQPIR